MPNKLDASRNGLGDELEGSELHSARGWLERQGYAIAISNGYQQVDSGTKMIQLGKDTSSRMPPLLGAFASSMTRSRSTEPVTGRHKE